LILVLIPRQKLRTNFLISSPWSLALAGKEDYTYPSPMNYGVWIKNHIRHPLKIDSLWPSSSALGSLMIRHINPATPGYILELGPGIGSFNRAILQRGIPEERLILLDQSPDFTELLLEAFPKARVLCGDATDVVKILQSFGVDEVSKIVSGAPLNAMEVGLRKTICEEAFKLLKPRGSFSQVSYLPIYSIPNSIVTRYHGQKIYSGIALRNIPPAFV